MYYLVGRQKLKSSTVNISFNKELLRLIDQVAKEESRSRSELIREAARGYIERKRKWNEIFEVGRKTAAFNGLTEIEIEKEIKSYRQAKRK
jgi:metal-responsive CopG/Arc/MetJ family transcriptional regulator